MMLSRKIPNPVDKHVGARVRMRRMLLGMSQEQLAQPLGLTFQQVQKYEKGTNRIGASRLQQIAGVLKVVPAFFFEGLPGHSGKESTPDYVAEFMATKDGLALVSAFGKIKNRNVRRSIVSMVECLADAA